MNVKRQQRSALGRGLSSLISSSPVPIAIPGVNSSQVTEPVQNLDQAEPGSVKYIPVEMLIANPEQPRQYFNPSELAELVSSIKTLGVLQPILVRPNVDGKFEIVAGERRFRAAQEAGLVKIPCIIKGLTDREALEISIVENVQRAGLNPVEEATAYNRLIEEHSLSAQEVAERVGKDRATVANLVRILRLPASILELVKEGKLSLGHAKAILTVKEPAAQSGLAKRAIEEEMSVRELESIVSRTVELEAAKSGRDDKRVRKNRSRFPELEDRLRNALGTKVLIRQGLKGRGKIELHYFSEQELDRLADMLLTYSGSRN